MSANPTQVEKFLGGVNYPCSKQDIIDTAIDNGADDNVVDTLKNMPGSSYNSPKDVNRAIGQIE